MPTRRFRASVPDREVETGLRRLRSALDVPASFPAPVDVETHQVLHRGPVVPPGAPSSVEDRTDLVLVTIDPVGARDLDQAVGVERRGRGYRVHYAIADVAAFVTPGGAIDDEARRRGLTLYLPDERSPLHPPALGEGAASLLPSTDRRALLWEHDLDADGRLERSRVRRAVVRSREMLSYAEAQARIDAGQHPLLLLLREVGERRLRLEVERGGVELQLPDQEIRRADHRYELVYDRPRPVEAWNAQISLLTGIAAARIMVDHGVGVLRTLPPPDPTSIDGLRVSARALAVDWPDAESYAHLMRRLDTARPAHVALAAQAARTLRGAGYLAFTSPDGRPDDPAACRHWAIAAEYAHVTAPLRRLVDRFGLEVCVAACADRTPPSWVLAALDELPETMDRARSKERRVERAVVDYLEALVLRHHVGEVFDATVTQVDDDGEGATVTLTDPPVITPVTANGLALGASVRLRLAAVDPDVPAVTLVPVP